MTMPHLAYAFAYSAFREELAPALERALATGEGDELRSFIDANLAALSDPYEGEPLPDDWRELLESGDVQELGEFALTKYYDADLDMGLDQDYAGIASDLEQAGVGAALLLGTPLGTAPKLFDPGRQGAYFQTEAEVRSSLGTLHQLVTKAPALSEPLAPLLGLFGQAVRAGKGLYVTF